jgi:hypothetical protein
MAAGGAHFVVKNAIHKSDFAAGARRRYQGMIEMRVRFFSKPLGSGERYRLFAR